MILYDKVVTARRKHFCDQCHRQILPDERYRKQVHTVDGFQVYKAHEDCDACASDIHAMANLYPEEYVILADDAVEEDKAWMLEFYPAVFERLFSR